MLLLLWRNTMSFKVMTFNIQHGRNHNLSGDNIDLELMANTVKAENPCIVGFNEIRKGKDVEVNSCFYDQPRFFAESLDGECKFGRAIRVKDNCFYGNAIFSKYNFDSFEVITIPDPDSKIEGYFYESRAITKSELNIDGKIVTVLTSHFGLAPNEQENAVKTVLELASEIKTPLVFMGDLNMTPDNPLIKKLSSCFEDVLKYVKCDEATFPSNLPKIRIDYIFSRGLKIIGAKTIRVISSDHFPIMAEFEI